MDNGKSFRLGVGEAAPTMTFESPLALKEWLQRLRSSWEWIGSDAGGQDPHRTQSWTRLTQRFKEVLRAADGAGGDSFAVVSGDSLQTLRNTVAVCSPNGLGCSRAIRSTRGCKRSDKKAPSRWLER